MDLISYILANGYTKETVQGGGAVAGKNVTVQSITPIEGGHRVTFGYTLDSGEPKTATMDVINGAKGDRGDRGEKGEKGADGAVDFADLTPEQKASLNGADGITPHVGGNGNWYIGDADTGISAYGIMSQADKDKLDGIESGAQRRIGNPTYIQSTAPSDTTALWVVPPS